MCCVVFQNPEYFKTQDDFVAPQLVPGLEPEQELEPKPILEAAQMPSAELNARGRVLEIDMIAHYYERIGQLMAIRDTNVPILSDKQRRIEEHLECALDAQIPRKIGGIPLH
ncbi:hypothetical protein BGZ54_007574 [Gamsiella multidivaricata]|nr:hypothetical protein BGZ54_007574 [Gamsiella multidivaricata]